MKSFPLLALLISLAACSNSCGGSSSVAGGGGGGANCDFQTGGDCSIAVNGVTRKFLLHIPANFQPNQSALVVALHGSQGSGSQMETQSQLSAKADSVGFAVAYPMGLLSAQAHTIWSVYFNDFAFTGTPPDDVAFLRAMINSIQANLRPDPKRIYIAGFSIGGYMSHRAGVELSDLVAAIGVVEGAISAIAPSDSRTVPNVVAPVSVLILHGSADNAIAYCGSSTATSVLASQAQAFNYWVGPKANKCSTLSTPTPLCDSAGNITAVNVKIATGCSSGAEVRFYKLTGGTHQWYNLDLNNPPGTASAPYNSSFDSTTGIVTDDILWNFFSSHPKP